MAYRLEQNPFTNIPELVIDGWERGISEGPYSIFSPSALGPVNQTGMVDLSYVNITGIPGEVSVQFPLVGVNYVGQSFTLTGSLSLGATSATLTGVWTLSTATHSTTFSNGNVRTVQYTNGSASITWSGGLSSSATTAINVNWNFTGPIQFTTNYTSFDYVLDQSGRVWASNETTSSGVSTWTAKGSTGNGDTSITNIGGCVWWQGYLFALYSGKIYYSSDNGVTLTDWTSIVGAINSGQNYAISSKVSDSLYFCNGNFVASVVLTPGATFNPTDTTTFTFNATAVKIPSYDTAMCLGELQTGQILIGGLLNRVYPWDANNLQGTGITSLVGLPLFIGDRGIRRIVVVNANAYIFPGLPNNAGTLVPSGRGYIYITNGSTIDIFQKMPDNFVSIGGSSSTVSNPYWYFGDAIWHRNQLIFGAVAADNISNSVITDTGGVWAIDLNSQALYRANEMVTSGNTSLPIGLLPFSITNGSITVPGLGYFSADGGTLDNTTNIMSTSGRVISDKIPVGTNQIPKTFSQIELKTAIALVAGESIDVSVITDLDPGGHAIGSMTSTDGMSRVFTPLSQSSSAVSQGIQWLQVQCVLNPTSTNPTFVRLREIRLR